MAKMKNQLSINDNLLEHWQLEAGPQAQLPDHLRPHLTTKPPEKNKETLLDSLEIQRAGIEAELKKVKATVKLVKNLKFTKGDIVYNKLVGACIVQSIHLAGMGLSSTGKYGELMVKAAHAEGTVEFKAEDFVLRTDMSESIYGK